MICKLSNVAFRLARRIGEFLVTIHDWKYKSLSCGQYSQTCGKAFKRFGHLVEHRLTHRTAESTVSIPIRHRTPTHRCPTCHKGFAKPSQLERHVRVHTGLNDHVSLASFSTFGLYGQSGVFSLSLWSPLNQLVLLSDLKLRMSTNGRQWIG